MQVMTLEIDLAKNILSVHGIDAHGKAVLKHAVSRGKNMETLAGVAHAVLSQKFDFYMHLVSDHGRFQNAVIFSNRRISFLSATCVNLQPALTPGR